MANANYMLSISTLFRLIGHENLDIQIMTISNESLITRARNGIVAEFLERDFTHLFFIDADISFKHTDVFRLLLRKKDIVAAAYPMKAVDWKNTIGSTSLEEAQRRSIHYVINFVREGESLAVKTYDGLLKVYDAGTGFMCISREAINQLIDAYGEEIEYTRDSVTLDDNGNVSHVKAPAWALFDTSIDKETNRYLSEDYTFCRRWQSLGNDIWLDPTVNLDHHGSYAYRGYPYLEPAQPTPPSA
jgi:hypothetical protein